MQTGKTRKRAKKTTSAQNKAWQFMRRNRVFRFGDIVMVTGISVSGLQYFLKHLHKEGYVKRMNNVRGWTDRTYSLLRDTGVNSPTITKHRFYDMNLEEGSA